MLCDTNVLIAQYKPTDLFYHESLAVTKALKEGEITGYTSPLTLIESCSFMSRNFPQRKGEDAEEMIKLTIAKVIKDFSKLRLRFADPTGDYSFSLNSSQEVRMPALFHQAFALTTTGLRTLDLFHLAAAKYLSMMTDSDLGAFVTGDSDFLYKKKELSKLIGVPILSPKEYVEGLGI
ncbi:MAG: type II toxin-antitoxin system VapC family toxin [Thaumarchaeota archaeon]|nr:type II toxin-antitoxin system VapC family toxin [Nitrososphaerota archaeon]